jgi:5-methylcytosine-specific restriction endonuclease McrA
VALVENGFSAEAEACFERALELNPGNTTARRRLEKQRWAMDRARSVLSARSARDNSPLHIRRGSPTEAVPRPDAAPGSRSTLPNDRTNAQLRQLPSHPVQWYFWDDPYWGVGAFAGLLVVVEFSARARLVAFDAGYRLWYESPQLLDRHLEDVLERYPVNRKTAIRRADVLRTDTGHAFEAFKRNWTQHRPYDPLEGKRTFATAEERARTYRKGGGLCHYCSIPLALDRRWHVEHFVPRSRGGGWHPSNLVLACEPCNMAKLDMGGHEFKILLDAYGLPWRDDAAEQNRKAFRI